MSQLVLRNQQRVRHVNLRLLRRVVEAALTHLVGLERYDLGIHLVASAEMTRLNETFLKHAGSTDVITFSYSKSATALHGEIIICVDEAISQSRRFRTTWQSELVRYPREGHGVREPPHRVNQIIRTLPSSADANVISR